MTENESIIEMNEVQRLYVGGMEPPNLTVEMVQTRLVKTLSDEIDILSFDTSKIKTNLWGEDTQTFFFMTAKVKSNPKGHYKSAIDAVSKLYHNVKWKGCTLRVEKAKLHFLERLQLEREQSKQLEKSIMGHELSNETQLSESRKMKRHLRIRRRYGEEAFVVDTKPMEASNQKELHLLLKKQREKLSKHSQVLVLSRKKKKDDFERESLKQEEKLTLQSKVFLNRSVHIYFNEDNIENTIVQNCLIDHDGSQKNISDEISETSSENSTASSADDRENRKKTTTNYNWSDDDADDNSITVARHETDKKINSEMNERDSSTDDHLQEPFDVDTTYNWSDSDDDHDEDIAQDETQNFDYNKTKHNDLDEFAASFTDEANHYKNDLFQQEESSNIMVEDINIDDEIHMNLSVISRLFPELQTKNPFILKSNVDPSNSSSIVNNFGLIKRYDPLAADAVAISEEKANNSENSEDFQSSTKSDGEKNSLSSESSIASDSKCNHSIPEDSNFENITISEPAIASVIDTSIGLSNATSEMNTDFQNNQNTGSAILEQIYDQKKLEDIFQQDRTSVGTTAFNMSSLFQSEINKVAPSAPIQQTSFGFSFSFQTNESDTKIITNQVDAINENISSSFMQVESLTASLSPERKTTLKKKVGILYSEEELNHYVNEFYNMNESIDSVVESLRNPNSEEYLKSQEKWQASRKSLTSDWKRKHKFAVSQRKKRMRFR